MGPSEHPDKLRCVAQVTGVGKLRLGQDTEFSQKIVMSGRLSELNARLTTMQYITGENVNFRLFPPDSIRVTMNDNGFGGLPPYNSVHEVSRCPFALCAHLCL